MRLVIATHPLYWIKRESLQVLLNQGLQAIAFLTQACGEVPAAWIPDDIKAEREQRIGEESNGFPHFASMEESWASNSRHLCTSWFQELSSFYPTHHLNGLQLILQNLPSAYLPHQAAQVSNK